MKNFISSIRALARHKISLQLSWYATGQLAVQFFSFFGVIVTSRYLGPTNVGLYSFVQNYLLVFMTITIGMDFYFTWKIAGSENKIESLVNFFGHKLNATIFLTAMGGAIAWTILPTDVAILATVMFVPLILTSCTAFFQYAVVTDGARKIALIQVASAALLFFLKMVLVVSKAPLIAFVIVNAIDTVLVSILLAMGYVLGRYTKSIRDAFVNMTFPSLRDTAIFMYSIKMSLIAIALWQLILRIDQLILAFFFNAYSLGIYAAAVKIAEVPNFLAGILYTALVSHVAFFAKGEDSHSKRRIRQVLFLYAGIGTFIALIIMVFAPYAIYFLYGSQFAEAVPVLRFYALSIPGIFVSFHYFSVYGAKDRHFSQSVLLAFALVLNVVLVYVFVPFYGLAGAALATAIAYTAVSFAFYLHVR